MTDFRTALSDAPAPSKELLNLFSKEDKLIIFDVGSCDGIDSLRYKRQFPNATIYAFEPMPANYKKIEDNFKKYGSVGVYSFQLALSNTTGKADFHLSSANPKELINPSHEHGNKSSSLLEPDKILSIYEWCEFNETVKVDTDTIDNFCSQHSINHIDLMHLDVQGAEQMVLEGSRNTLSNIHTIWIEVENVSLYKKQPLRKHIQHFLKKNGFILIRYDHRYYSGDQLYANRGFIQETKDSVLLKQLLRKECIIKMRDPFNGFKRILQKIILKFRY